MKRSGTMFRLFVLFLFLVLIVSTLNHFNQLIDSSLDYKYMPITDPRHQRFMQKIREVEEAIKNASTKEQKENLYNVFDRVIHEFSIEMNGKDKSERDGSIGRGEAPNPYMKLYPRIELSK